MKATAQGPSNIAFLKYWGKTNEELTLPQNSSLSMSLDSLLTTTTVEFSPNLTEDIVELAFFGEDFKVAEGSKKKRVTEHLDRIRTQFGEKAFARIRSSNNFPAEVGIASSASAFAALTAAACAALNQNLTPKDLSILTRLGGSGSATRSIIGGFVEWEKGSSNATSYAMQIAPETHWKLYDIVVIVSTGTKKISSLEGHDLALTSPFYNARLAELPARLQTMKQAILAKDLHTLGIESEKDAISLHTTAMTSQPPIWYWHPSTLEVVQAVYSLREKGLNVYFTMDAGPNVHLICEEDSVAELQQYFGNKPYVQRLFTSHAGKGTILIDKHLF